MKVPSPDVVAKNLQLLNQPDIGAALKNSKLSRKDAEAALKTAPVVLNAEQRVLMKDIFVAAGHNHVDGKKVLTAVVDGPAIGNNREPIIDALLKATVGTDRFDKNHAIAQIASSTRPINEHTGAVLKAIQEQSYAEELDPNSSSGATYTPAQSARRDWVRSTLGLGAINKPLADALTAVLTRNQSPHMNTYEREGLFERLIRHGMTAPAPGMLPEQAKVIQIAMRLSNSDGRAQMGTRQSYVEYALETTDPERLKNLLADVQDAANHHL